MAYLELHKINNRATPSEFCNYKHALLLYKIIHTELPMKDWVDLSFQQTLSTRCKSFNFFETNNFKVGNNLICNILCAINGKIDFDQKNESFESYKVKSKLIFINSPQ